MAAVTTNAKSKHNLLYPPEPICGGYRPTFSRPSEIKDREWRFDRDCVVPLLYGRKKVPGIPIPVGVKAGWFYICYVFCEGEIGGFDEYEIDDKPLEEFAGLYGLTAYHGTLTQDYDEALHEANAAWVEKLPGTAYVAARFKADAKFSGVPELRAVLRGRLLYDPRNDATYYNNNPILESADHLRSNRYGAGAAENAIDWDLVGVAATVCDGSVGDEPRFECNYLIANPTEIGKIQSYLLGHCNGERVFSEGVYKFYIHQARDAVAVFTEHEVWGVKFSRPKAAETCNRIRAGYTLTDTWQEDEYTLESPALIAGDEYASEASFDFTGCGSLSQVHRLAVFQLNVRISDLLVSFSSHDLQGLERYDRFILNHSHFGGVDLDFFVLAASADTITAREYSENLFSDDIITGPNLPEVSLPSPLEIPADATGLELVEVFRQAKDGRWVSLILAEWTPSVYPWVDYYEIWLRIEGDDFRLYGVVEDPAAELLAVSELKNYTVKIVTVSRWRQKSTGLSETIFIEGKNWPPTWPSGAAISGAEAGDVVVLAWDAALDADTVRYEIRRGPTSGSWENGVLVATIDALNYFDRAAPVGIWRYYVKAIDSVGQYTATALSIDLEVKLNPNLAFNRNQYLDLAGATASQVAVSPSGTSADQAFPQVSPTATWADWFSSDPTKTWADFFGGDPGKTWLQETPTSGTISLETDPVDMGAQFSGEFVLNYAAEKIGSGSASIAAEIGYSLDGASYTWVAAGSAVTLTARHIKARFTWTCGDASTCYVLSEPVYINIKAIPVIEYGTATVPAGGMVSISFAMTFTAVDKVLVSAQGSSAKIALADNISLTGFDIYLFNTSGAAVSGTVGWKVEGV